jgi:hypothetical protein
MNIVQDIEKLDTKMASLHVSDIIMCPTEYPIELCGAVYEILKNMSGQIYESMKRIEGRIIGEMEVDNATKLKYINIANEERTITLKEGARKVSVKEPEAMIKNSGFDPNQLGTYEYKLKNWSELKEQIKFGGELKNLIESLYSKGNKSLSIV